MRNDSCTQTLSRNNTETADQAADGQVDHHGAFAVFGPKVEGDDGAGDDDDTSEAEEAGRNDPLLHVLDGCHRRLLWGAECDDDGADDALETAHFSNEAEALFEEYGGENGADDDGESAHWCY